MCAKRTTTTIPYVLSQFAGKVDI